MAHPSLRIFPPETLEYVTHYLGSCEQTRLWLCGDRALQLSLARGGIKRFQHVAYHRASSMSWTPIVAHFSKLTVFIFDFLDLSCHIEFRMTYNHIFMLPPTLTTLKLLGDNAEGCLWKREPEHLEENRRLKGRPHVDHKPPFTPSDPREKMATELFDLGVRFPNLTCLRLHETDQSLSLQFEDCCMALLPPHLTDLRLNLNSSLTTKCLPYLPPHLTSFSMDRLAVPGFKLLELLSALPRSLVSLCCLCLELDDLSVIQHSPKGITSLQVLVDEDLPPDQLGASLAEHLPALKKLNLSGAHYSWLQYYPKSIRTLKLTESVVDVLDPVWPPNVTHIKFELQYSLEYFNVLTSATGPRRTVTIVDDDLHWSTVQELVHTLPPNITRLRIQKPHGLTEDAFPRTSRYGSLIVERIHRH